MSVKSRVLEELESHRGVYFSGQTLAAELGVTRTAVWKAIGQLRSEGYPIDAVQNRGYCLRSDSTLLSPQSIAQYVTVPGLNIQVYDKITSTFDVLRPLAEADGKEGEVAVAIEQTAGKGRRGNKFFSPKGTGLYFSFLLRPRLSAKDSLSLTACAAAAVALAIEDCAGVEAEIKWVNDVFVNGKKVCGILTEAALDLESGGLQYAIVGIGVNLLLPEEDLPEELRSVVGAVYQQPPARDHELRSQMAGAILNRFFAYYADLENKPFFGDYRRRSLVIGKRLIATEGSTTRPVTALDVEPDFTLKVREEDGSISRLSSGEVRVKPVD